MAQLNRVATAGLTPDLTLLLDYPAELGLARARLRNHQHACQAESRFELEELAFHQRVRSAYLALAAGQARFRVLDAQGSVVEVANRIAAVVDAFLSGRAAS